MFGEICHAHAGPGPGPGIFDSMSELVNGLFQPSIHLLGLSLLQYEKRHASAQ